MILRPYQRNTIDALYSWFGANKTGNPCIVLPTGSGKSVVIASFCREACESWPSTRILMVTASKELVSQNYAKVRTIWPSAPAGIYCAGLKRKEIEQLTFASIGSIYSKSQELGHIDIVIVDEAHNISHKNQGRYRALINDLAAINPHVRVIGFSASPYRLGHGYITGGEALFNDLIEPEGTSVLELVEAGYLAPLRSRLPNELLNIDGVKKRGGEYIASQLQNAVNTDKQNAAAVAEILRLADERKAWLIFCAGVDHAQNIAALLNAAGIVSECVTGSTPDAERDDILTRFKAGQIKAVTNCDVLTTGFDYPDIDLIAMLRPTESPGLYCQQAGRGMRLKSHTDHCLVLDFAGNVQKHGPITHILPPGRKGEGKGDPIVKVCENADCKAILHAAVRICPDCGFEFPEPKKKTLALHNDDIMGHSFTATMQVRRWQWAVHQSRKTGVKLLRCTYYPKKLNDRPVQEFLNVFASFNIGDKARRELALICRRCEVPVDTMNLDTIAHQLNLSTPPAEINYKRNGKFYDIISRDWQANTEDRPILALEKQAFYFERAALSRGVSQDTINAEIDKIAGINQSKHLRCCSQQIVKKVIERLKEL